MNKDQTQPELNRKKTLWKPLVLTLCVVFAFGLPEVLSAYNNTPSTEWVFECVDCPKKFSQMTGRSLRLDADGDPHIAYGKSNLYYAWSEGGSWNYTVVDDSPYVGRFAALDLDENGYAHISYFDSANGDLKYAYEDVSGWHIVTVDSSADVGRYTSLALDGSWYPHISYYDSSNGDLKYAYQDVSGWYTETVDADGNVGQYTSLALDGDEYAHI